MTVSEQLSAAKEYQQLWHALMPNIPAPAFDQFVLWAGGKSPEYVSRGINRAARKSLKMRDTDAPMTTEAAVRYATSVMRHESLGERKFESPEQAGSIAA